MKSTVKIIYLDAGVDFAYSGNNIKSMLDFTYPLKNKYKFHEIFNVFEYELK